MGAPPLKLILRSGAKKFKNEILDIPLTEYVKVVDARLGPVNS